MPLSPREMKAAILRNLQQNTGRDLDEWKQIIRSRNTNDRRELVSWLKRDHGLGQVTAGYLAGEAAAPPGRVDPTDEDLIAAQYEGVRMQLRGILDEVTRQATRLGEDVVVYATKNYVSFRRVRQFAVVKPAGSTGVDLCLVLPTAHAGHRLHAATSRPNDRITHTVSLTSAGDVDTEVVDWIRTAYDQDGERRRGARSSRARVQ
ncbi:MAG TPA: DUF5655 domain-containing protein [Thermoanaerobaculia bacterium]|nr:DUF5655 domain-containing protein [Thermoanaerobaculia bacterium]